MDPTSAILIFFSLIFILFLSVYVYLKRQQLKYLKGNQFEIQPQLSKDQQRKVDKSLRATQNELVPLESVNDIVHKPKLAKIPSPIERKEKRDSKFTDPESRPITNKPVTKPSSSKKHKSKRRAQTHYLKRSPLPSPPSSQSSFSSYGNTMFSESTASPSNDVILDMTTLPRQKTQNRPSSLMPTEKQNHRKTIMVTNRKSIYRPDSFDNTLEDLVDCYYFEE
eukprot:NODE_395_length_8134_cov_0.767393.p5 type:complete len:223 gc:universal NODE_395_length_8134_cov_0.767393:8035-7367(-)